MVSVSKTKRTTTFFNERSVDNLSIKSNAGWSISILETVIGNLVELDGVTHHIDSALVNQPTPKA